MLDYLWNICQVTEGGRPLLIIHDALGHHIFQPLKLNSVLTSVFGVRAVLGRPKIFVIKFNFICHSYLFITRDLPLRMLR